MDMGMTDKQFDAYLRLLLKTLKNAYNEKDLEKVRSALDEIFDELQRTIED